jgi:hypothetical protein
MLNNKCATVHLNILQWTNFTIHERKQGFLAVNKN